MDREAGSHSGEVSGSVGILVHDLIHITDKHKVPGSVQTGDFFAYHTVIPKSTDHDKNRKDTMPIHTNYLL